MMFRRSLLACLLAFLFALVLAPAALSAPFVDTASSASAFRRANLQWTHTLNPGTGRYLLVFVTAFRAPGDGTPIVGGASVCGIEMTDIVEFQAISSDDIYTWGFWLDETTLPAPGACTIQVRFAGPAADQHGHAISLFGVDPGVADVLIAGSNETQSGTISTDITTTASDTLLVELAGHNQRASLTPTAGQSKLTEKISQRFRNFTATSIATASGVGLQTETWSTGSPLSDRKIHLIAALSGATSGLLANAEWVSIPNSSMDTVYIASIDDQWSLRGFTIPNAFGGIQSTWSGATCIGDELYIFGGGHDDSTHNGIFSVDVNSGLWTRVREPSGLVWPEIGCPDAGGGQICSTPYGDCEIARCNPQPLDAAPASRHTYYLLTNDGSSLYVVGGAAYQSGTAGDPPTGWRYDIAADEWTPLPEAPNAKAHGAMAYVDGKLYLITTDAPTRTIFDLSTELWDTGLASQSLGAGGQTALIYAQPSDRLFNLGGGQARYVARSTWNTVQATTILNPPALISTDGLGATYYPPEDLILLWDGGQTFTTLDATTLQWGSVTPPGENPGAALGTGTYGRLSYCGNKVNLVNGVTKDLFYLDIDEAGPVCGNGLVEPPEECDDGGTTSGDSCSATCTTETAVCGNGDIETVPPWLGVNETCDDGGTANGDGCDSTCQIESVPGACVGGVANNIVNEPEECDDGPNGTVRCSTDCEIIFPPAFTSAGPAAMPVWLTPPTDPVTGVVATHCGDESTWTVLEITTDTEANQDNRTGKYIMNVHWKETPYPAIRVRNGQCVKVVGINGPLGQRPLVTNVNKTRAIQNSGVLFRGGLIIENLTISPGLAFTLTGGALGGSVADCVGVPNDQDFLIIRDSEISRCGHHAFLTAHSHQMYVEVDNVHMFQANTHLAYIDHVAMAYIHDSQIESPGSLHALRSVAANTIIENTQISNIQLDGTILPPGGDNPLVSPTKTYIGQHPLDVYVCGNNTITDVDIVFHSDMQRNGLFAANLRAREAFQSCDIGEPSAGFYTPLSYLRNNADFQNPARWATTTPFNATVTNMTVTCTASGVACNGWDVDGIWPTMNDPEKTQLQRWLRSRTFLNWDELLTEIAFNPEWAWIASRTLTQHRGSFMAGTNPNKIPVPAPIPGWYQRANLTLNNFQFLVGGNNVIRPLPVPDTFCYGTPAEGNACTEQFDGAQYRQAFITINP